MENSVGPQRKEAPVDVSTERPPVFENMRNELLSFRSSSEGLNMQRVDDFLVQRGLEVKNAVVFRNGDVSGIERILKPMNLPPEFDLHDVYGLYISEIDLVLVRRPPGIDEADRVRMESYLAHEKAHASGGHTNFVELRNGRIFAPRSGFALPENAVTGDGDSWGTFLEEGFAEMVAGEYTQTYMSEEEKNKILRIFGESSDRSAASTVKNVITYGDEQLSLPVKYIYPDGYSYNYTYSGPAAFGLELLCKKSPELYQTLVAARTDIQSLRKIPQLINGIKEGLHAKLMRLENAADPAHTDSFYKGLKMIIDEVYCGTLPLNDKNEVI